LMTNLYRAFRTAGATAFLLAAGLGGPLASHAQYMPGNLVVLRVGDGTVQLSGNSAAVATFLVEYTPAGVLRSTIDLNATGPDNKLTNTGNSQGEGMLTLSADGRYLVTAGYNAPVGTAAVMSTTATAIPRTVARIDANGIVDISTALTNTYSGGNIRSTASLDGSSFFLSGSTTGVRYAALGAAASSSISTTITSPRVMRIYRNRVYFSTSSTSGGAIPGIYALDVPTNTASGQTATSFIPTSGTNAASPYGFILLDRDPAIPGFDAAYVADDGIGSAAGGIQKWSFDGTTWTKRGSIGSAYRGLTGTINPSGSVTLYATTNTSAGGNDLVTVTDTSPYNMAPSTTAVSVIATAASNAAFRGVEFAPGTVVVLPVVLTRFGASRTAAGVQLRWATASENNSARFEVQRSLDGRTFATVASLPAAGSSQLGRTYATVDGAAPLAALYYRLRQVDQDGTAQYSSVVTLAAGADLLSGAYPNPAREVVTLAPGQAAGQLAEVRDLHGRLVRSARLAADGQLSLAGLAAGTYALLLDGRFRQLLTKID
jgi:hypothetical protein